MIDKLTRAKQHLEGAQDLLREAGNQGSSVEFLILLPLIKRVADSRNEVEALIHAKTTGK